MQLPQTVEVKGIRVLTSKQLADEYDASVKQIKQNFSNNRDRFVEGKHYISFTGDDLRIFKNQVENFDLVANRTSHLYLWTEKGALLHAKSLNTDKAWQAYEYLVDYYFRTREDVQKPVTHEIVLKGAPAGKKKNAGQIPHMDNPLAVLHVLLQVAEEEGIEVRSFPFQNIDSVLKGKCIGIRQQLSMEKVTYELAWELAHLFIHYNAGNIIESPLAKEYNDQATRVAGMIIRMLNRQVSGV